MEEEQIKPNQSLQTKNWSLVAILCIAALGIIIGALFIIQKKSNSKLVSQLQQPQTQQPQAVNMKLTSSAFQNQENIPSKYTCDGQNINPPLTISEVPENTQSLALIVDDPDAPAGTWIHWVIFNIDPKTKMIDENNVPQVGIEGITSFGKPGYGGPCPPSGTHRYFFKLYALDSTLNLSSSADKSDVERAFTGNILAQAELVGTYAKNK